MTFNNGRENQEMKMGLDYLKQQQQKSTNKCN